MKRTVAVLLAMLMLAAPLQAGQSRCPNSKPAPRAHARPPAQRPPCPPAHRQLNPSVAQLCKGTSRHSSAGLFAIAGAVVVGAVILRANRDDRVVVVGGSCPPQREDDCRK